VEHSVVAGLPGWVGRRVVVRHLLPDGRATDALGTLLHVDEDRLRLRRDRVPQDGSDPEVEVSLGDVVLARTVPPPPPRRPRQPPPDVP